MSQYDWLFTNDSDCSEEIKATLQMKVLDFLVESKGKKLREVLSVDICYPSRNSEE